MINKFEYYLYRCSTENSTVQNGVVGKDSSVVQKRNRMVGGCVAYKLFLFAKLIVFIILKITFFLINVFLKE